MHPCNIAPIQWQYSGKIRTIFFSQIAIYPRNLQIFPLQKFLAMVQLILLNDVESILRSEIGSRFLVQLGYLAQFWLVLTQYISNSNQLTMWYNAPK